MPDCNYELGFGLLIFLKLNQKDLLYFGPICTINAMY